MWRPEDSPGANFLSTDFQRHRSPPPAASDVEIQADIDKAAEAVEQVRKLLSEAIPNVTDAEQREAFEELLTEMTKAQAEFVREAPKIFAELEQQTADAKKSAAALLQEIEAIEAAPPPEPLPPPPPPALESKDPAIGPRWHAGILKRYFSASVASAPRAAVDINFDSWLVKTNLSVPPAPAAELNVEGLEALHRCSGDLEKAGIRLPDRHAIWWAVRTITGACSLADVQPTAAEAAVVRNAIRWITNETMDLDECFAPSSAPAGLTSPTGFVALAILRASGRKNVGPDLAGPQSPAYAAVQAVALAGQVNGGRKAAAIYALALDIAKEVSTGIGLWPNADPPLPPIAESAGWSNWLINSVSIYVAGRHGVD